MTFLKVTPNLLVRDVARSLAFYRDVLGFDVVTTVPEQSPFAFVWLQRDAVSIFLNDAATAAGEYASLTGRPLGGSFTIYIALNGIDEYYRRVSPRATIEAELDLKFYGMKEFAVSDPDGYVLTFAEETCSAAL